MDTTRGPVSAHIGSLSCPPQQEAAMADRMQLPLEIGPMVAHRGLLPLDLIPPSIHRLCRVAPAAARDTGPELLRGCGSPRAVDDAALVQVGRHLETLCHYIIELGLGNQAPELRCPPPRLVSAAKADWCRAGGTRAPGTCCAALTRKHFRARAPSWRPRSSRHSWTVG